MHVKYMEKVKAECHSKTFSYFKCFSFIWFLSTQRYFKERLEKKRKLFLSYHQRHYEIIIIPQKENIYLENTQEYPFRYDNEIYNANKLK